MGTATLGFAGGPAVAFRLDPENISWDFQVITNVIETVGGRVIQVIGSYLNNMTVQGSFGEDHKIRAGGESWRQAQAFLNMITQIMEYQSADANQQAKMQPPAVFSYPPKNYRFNVYVDSLTDATGGSNSLRMTPGTINQRYTLALFIVSDASQGLVQAGSANGVLSQKAEQAIAAYMDRISAGVGWEFTVYTGQSAATIPSKTGKKAITPDPGSKSAPSAAQKRIATQRLHDPTAPPATQARKPPPKPPVPPSPFVPGSGRGH